MRTDKGHLNQRVLSSKVAAWEGFPHDAEMTARYGHRDRVDRMRWQVLTLEAPLTVTVRLRAY